MNVCQAYHNSDPILAEILSIVIPSGLLRMVDISKEVSDDLATSSSFTVHVDKLGKTKAIQLVRGGSGKVTVQVRDMDIEHMIEVSVLSL